MNRATNNLAAAAVTPAILLGPAITPDAAQAAVARPSASDKMAADAVKAAVARQYSDAQIARVARGVTTGRGKGGRVGLGNLTRFGSGT